MVSVDHTGGELLLAAPQQQVPRVLARTHLIDVFPVHATVAEAAAGSAGHSRRTAMPAI
jgi:STAS domain-containing protein